MLRAIEYLLNFTLSKSYASVEIPQWALKGNNMDDKQICFSMVSNHDLARALECTRWDTRVMLSQIRELVRTWKEGIDNSRQLVRLKWGLERFENNVWNPLVENLERLHVPGVPRDQRKYMRDRLTRFMEDVKLLGLNKDLAAKESVDWVRDQFFICHKDKVTHLRRAKLYLFDDFSDMFFIKEIRRDVFVPDLFYDARVENSLSFRRINTLLHFVSVLLEEPGRGPGMKRTDGEAIYFIIKALMPNPEDGILTATFKWGLVLTACGLVIWYALPK